MRTSNKGKDCDHVHGLDADRAAYLQKMSKNKSFEKVKADSLSKVIDEHRRNEKERKNLDK